jgi:glycerate 2-kinase
MGDPHLFLRRLFDAAVAAADPAVTVPAFLPEPPRGRTIVIGAGKASAVMAQAVERHWPRPLEGLVVTRYGYGAPCARIEIVEAAHPVPDEAGLVAARRLVQLVRGLSADDLVIALISGGGSALLPLPLAPMSLADEQAVNRVLLASGAGIGEMNCVRRHLSAIKGGRLAAACHPARLVSLLISDVPGDDPCDIASGPTIADPTHVADALAIIERWRMDLPAAALEVLRSADAESVKPGDARLAGARAQIVAAPQISLEAAAAAARAEGIEAHILSDAIEGEARDVGRVMAGLARQVATRGQPFRAPCVLLSGGETTVTFRPGDDIGSGGRNVEFLLSLAIGVDGAPGVHALACDTDGVDGAAEIAGACIGPDVLARAWAAGLNPKRALSRHDGHGFFSRLGLSVVTGPTLTNVNDFRAVLIEA